MLAEVDEEVDEGCSLAQNCGTAGVGGDEPGLGTEGAAVADVDGALVVLVTVVEGAFDEVGGQMYVGRVDDEGLTVDNEVVQEERLYGMGGLLMAGVTI